MSRDRVTIESCRVMQHCYTFSRHVKYDRFLAEERTQIIASTDLFIHTVMMPILTQIVQSNSTQFDTSTVLYK